MQVFMLNQQMTGWEKSVHHPNGVYYEGVVDPLNPPEPIEGMTDISGSWQRYAGGSAGTFYFKPRTKPINSCA